MWTNFIRNLLSDKNDRYIFDACREDDKDFRDCPNVDLYIHIPFCKSSCPYCPYVTTPYDENLSERYQKALLSEIALYADVLKWKKSGSIYIGGGTPTLAIERLSAVLDYLREAAQITGPIAIETTPSDITTSKAKALVNAGIHYVSLGVQSFNPKYLDLLGRSYDENAAGRAIELLMRSNFQLVNIDMIFAFPDQTMDELTSDLAILMRRRPHQVTVYPLFTFPYTTVGRFLGLKKLKMPNVFKRREMYYEIIRYLEKHGYHQSSVWSFAREDQNASYSSVTRDYYLGLGVGAASYTGKGFYFNTFSTEEYIKTTLSRRPTALKMNISQRMEKLFWLYWRLYETDIPADLYSRHFNREIQVDFQWLLFIAKRLGMFSSDNHRGIKLNSRGAYWIHLLQNYFALDYVSKIWSHSQTHPWPEKIVL